MHPPFPTDVQEFDSDDRISFSKLDNKFIAVHEDGSEFEFDAEWRRWVPAAEDTLADDSHEYGGSHPAAQDGNGRHAPAKKRKNGPEDGSEVRRLNCIYYPLLSWNRTL